MTRKQWKMKLRGNRLRAMRERAGLSQEEMGRRCGVSLRMVGRYEGELSEPTAHVLAQIAKELNCSADYLLGLVDEPSAISAEFSAEDRDLMTRFRQLPEDLRDIIMALVFRK